MRALSSELASRYDRGSVVFCIGVMADKDYAEMLKLLVPLAKRLYVTAPIILVRFRNPIWRTRFKLP